LAITFGCRRNRAAAGVVVSLSFWHTSRHRASRLLPSFLRLSSLTSSLLLHSYSSLRPTYTSTPRSFLQPATIATSLYPPVSNLLYPVPSLLYLPPALSIPPSHLRFPLILLSFILSHPTFCTPLHLVRPFIRHTSIFHHRFLLLSFLSSPFPIPCPAPALHTPIHTSFIPHSLSSYILLFRPPTSHLPLFCALHLLQSYSSVGDVMTLRLRRCPAHRPLSLLLFSSSSSQSLTHSFSLPDTTTGSTSPPSAI
jgi:hypothetical protein